MDTSLWIEILGWCGMALIIVGRLGIAYKQRLGFLLAVMGGALVGTQAILMHNISIIFLCFILLIIDFKGWLYWRNKNE